MRATFVAIIAAVAVVSPGESRAQNDWQYPDPYFGVLEIEKSRPPTSERRSRAEVRPPQRNSAGPRRTRWSMTRQRGSAQPARGVSP